MSNKRKALLSTTQLLSLLAISILFIILIWRMFPINPWLKAALLCMGGVFVVLLVISFYENLEYTKSFSSKWSAIFVTAIIFLFIPLINNLIYNSHEKEYLVSFPANEDISFKITCNTKRLGGGGSIGGEWTRRHFLNGQRFSNGDILTLGVNTPFFITSRIIENDGISDIGETVSDTYTYAQNDNYKKTLVISQKVHVRERGGRQNAGSTADFSVTYTLKRVLPDNMCFWDVLLLAKNASEIFFCHLLIWGQILNIGFIAFIIFHGKKQKEIAQKAEREKEAFEAEQTRIQKEQKFLEEKEAFLNQLNGKTLREVAGVPLNISFVNGLPKDNNDTTYGSFTVYYSKSGSCYHDKAGCCSARFSMHFFNAKKIYRPCSKCCTNHREVPQWYIDYIRLKRQAQTYAIKIE